MFVIAKPFGQLCNRLVRAANFIAAAIDQGRTIADPSFGEYADLFETTSRDILCRFPARESLLKPTVARRMFAAERVTRLLDWANCHAHVHRMFRPVSLPSIDQIFPLDDDAFFHLTRRSHVLLFKVGVFVLAA